LCTEERRTTVVLFRRKCRQTLVLRRIQMIRYGVFFLVFPAKEDVGKLVIPGGPQSLPLA